MRSRGWLWLGIVVTAIVALSGCWLRAKKVRIAAGTQGSAVHRLGTTLADTFNAHVGSVRVSVVEGEETRDSMKTLLEGNAELAVAFSDVDAEGDVRTLVPLYELYLYMVVWDDLGVEEVPDLKGRKIGVGPKGSGTDDVARHLFDHYALGKDDVNLVNASYRDTKNSFLERKLDAVFVLASTDSDAVGDMLAAPGAKLLSLDDPGRIAPVMDGIRTTNPFVVSHIIPKHLFGAKPDKPTGVIGVNALLVARSDLSDDVARDLTRAVYENKVELGRKEPRLRDLSEPMETNLLRFPLHPGAMQYYSRDEPPAIFKWAETISLAITVCLLSWSGLAAFAARRRARKKGFLDDLFKEFVRVVNSYDEEGETQPDQMTHDELQVIREKLQALRRRSFEALTAGTVEATNAFVVFNDYLRYELQEIERIQRERRKDASIRGSSEAPPDSKPGELSEAAAPSGAAEE